MAKKKKRGGGGGGAVQSPKEGPVIVSNVDILDEL